MSRVWVLAGIVWLEMIRRRDLYVLLMLLAVLLTTLLSFDVFGLAGVTGYVKDLGLLAVWILGWIMAVNTSVRQLPCEERQGTLFPLLAKPVSRLALILGKWLGAWTVACFALACFYLTLCLGIRLKGGGFDPATLLQAVLLHGAALAMVCAIGLALSTRLNQDAATVMTYLGTGAAFVLLPRIPAMLVGTQGLNSWILHGAYYLLPHLELCDLRRRLVHDWGHAGWRVTGEILLYTLLMTAVFLTLAWLGFRRRQFSRGAVL
jgi:ABC-type transport system involved in multi-copper enzyme maturation permease subunit